MSDPFGKNESVADVVIYDLETSARSVYNARILQIAYVSAQKALDTGEVRILETGSHYLKYPKSLLPFISQGAVDVHGIDEAFLKKNGEDYFEILTKLYKVFNHTTLIGFNSKRFDDVILHQHFDLIGLKDLFYQTSYVDVYEKHCIRSGTRKGKLGDLLAQGVSPSLFKSTRRKLFGAEAVDLEGHDARYDVVATYLLWKLGGAPCE